MKAITIHHPDLRRPDLPAGLFERNRPVRHRGQRRRGGAKSFRNDVLPILNANGCSGCHGGNGGLTVTSVGALLAGGDHGPAVVPGNADSSNLVRKLLSPPAFGSRMPLGGSPLPDASVGLIRAWINEGAKDN